MGSAPFDGYRDRVRPEWIDYNGHLNVGYYAVVFDLATDAWLDHLGLTAEFRQVHAVTTFTLESHETYLRELREGDPLRFTTQLLDFDAKRIHYFHCLHHADDHHLAATAELMSLHVSQTTRRGAPMAPEIVARLRQVQSEHAALPRPPQAGRHIGLTVGRAS